MPRMYSTPPADLPSDLTRFDLRELPAAFFDDPYPTYDQLRAHSPVHRLPEGSLLLTRHADLCRVYRDAHTFSSAKHVEFAPKYGLGTPLYAHHTTSLVFNDAPAHTQVRRLLMGALTRRAVAQMEPGLTRLVDALLDTLQARGQGCLIDDFASAIPVDVIGNLLAIPAADRKPLRAWSLAILGALEPRLSSAQLQAGHEAVTAFRAYLIDLVADRRRHPGDPEHDVLTRLIAGTADPAGASGTLDDDSLLHNCIFILNAGHETTTNLIGNSLVALTQHEQARDQMLSFSQQQTQQNQRQIWEKTSKTAVKPDFEPDSVPLDTAIDELLRFESSNQLGNRRALRDFELGGVRYPAGTLLTLCIGAANRDPAVFDAPHQLQLTRNPNRHLAFGLGVHQCAGLSLARLEGRVAISRFIARFPNYRLSKPPVRSQRVRFRGFVSANFSTC